ncbi:MAG: hypothetical protein MSS85_00625 [Pyramidobacter sp.]|nr:hypothetical protein [Pyramidobacter sp.]
MWETAIGRIKSVSNNPINGEISSWMANFFSQYAARNKSFIINELNYEIVRQKFFPKKVSRLRCIYCFQNRDDVYRSQKWGGVWDEDYITEVLIALYQGTQVTKVDSNWVHAYQDQESTPMSDWIYKYWSGEAYDGGTPLWEYLLCGSGCILNNKLQQMAYERTMEQFPYSTPLLYVAVAAFSMLNMDEFARVIPYLGVDPKNKFHGQLVYLLHVKEFLEKDPKLVEAVELFKNNNYTVPIKFPPNSDTFFQAPDWTQKTISLPLIDIERVLNIVNAATIL